MKDSEFTELLNLYLDHEITPADAARLEAEVQGNPARRQIYRDYCRMQKACSMLSHDFASAPAAAGSSEHKRAAFEAAGTRRTHDRLYYLGGALAAAAAALVAMFYMNRGGNPAATPNDTPAIARTAPVAPTDRPASPVQLVAAQTTPSRDAARPMPSMLTLQANPQANTLLLSPSTHNDPHFAWLQDVRLAPLQPLAPAEQLRFDVNGAQRQENRTYNSAKPLPADVPWVAIRFQK